MTDAVYKQQKAEGAEEKKMQGLAVETARVITRLRVAMQLL